MVEASFGTFGPFNERVRHLFEVKVEEEKALQSRRRSEREEEEKALARRKALQKKLRLVMAVVQLQMLRPAPASAPHEAVAEEAI